MAFSVQMPALGESVTEGTVTRWLKREGDHVDVDEPLLEVSTDKVDTEIPSPAAGVLSRIVVSEDETAEVGAELAVIDESGSGAGNGQAQAQAGSDAADGHQQPAPDDEGFEPEPDTGDQQRSERAAQREQDDTGASASDVGSDVAEESGGPARGPADGGTTVTMPALGESVTEGTVTRWLKQVGDHVDADEPLLEVSTDKVDTEIPSPATGTLLEIKVGEDQTVEVGADLAVIGSGEPARQAPRPEAPREEAPREAEPAEAREPEPPADRQPAQREEREPEPARQQAQPAGAGQDQGQGQAAAPAWPGASYGTDEAAAEAQRAQQAQTDGQPASAPYVTPLVRKLAAEHDIDLARLRGTGVGGRIRKQDVLAAAEARRAPEPEPEAAPEAAQAPGAPAPSPAAAKLRGTTQKMSRLRQVIARRMVESLQTSAQLTTVVEVDVSRIARLRDRAKRGFQEREGVKLSFLPFFAKATVEALKQHPVLNASIDTETNEVTYHGAEHLGIAVDTERGLLVAVVHQAGDLSIAGLARRIADLAERTRANKITPDDISGGTFTLTNTGSRGALFDTPIINQPQVAILGTGAVVKRPVVVTDDTGGDTIAIRSMCYLALSYDHRIVDGADAARFLGTVKERLEAGAFEADLGL
ncbi:MAG TPA: 2-oxoglutarate dehydrogenase, E2 component, dihydrolipoamide succinyltransferase [Pseudonocardiaceae bacterium]|nr:2-oxoglutarate dehydrogenase, E2 component, dihydrolipoamide succinyltransferase [Pseudonocardiaceae bacterium]